MESLLQVSDSSDDSDNEGLEQITAGTSVPAAAAVAAIIQPPPAPPVAAAVPPAPPAATGAPTSQSELSSRLKSLYSPANKAPTQQTAPSAQAPVAARPVQQSNTQQQQQQQQVRMQSQQQQQAQQKPSQPSASSGFRPLVPNSRLPPPQQQQQQQTSQSASAPPADPFEPTPLKTMIERQKQKQAAKQQQQQQNTPSNTTTTVPPSSSVPLRSSGGTSNSSTTSASSASTIAVSNVSTLESARSRQEREAKARKEKFLMFTRVLMKYLEQKDPDMHLKAKTVIRECAQKNKAQEKGYESVTASMQTRLRAMVGENYWTRAEQYLEHFLKQKKKIETKKSNSSSQQSSRPSTSSTGTTKSAEQVAKERQMAAYQQKKLVELKRDQEKIRQQAEMQKRQAAAAEKARVEQKRKQQEQMARVAAKQAAEQQAKKKGGNKQKNAASSTSASLAAGAAAAAAARASPIWGQTKVDAATSREYNELMQLVDHSVDYDWTSAALLLGREAKTDVNLNTEQKRLLYGSRLVPPVQTNTRGMEAATQSEEPSSELPASMNGWGSRNVLSSRGAWARLRLREQREQLKQGGTQQPPVVGGLQLPVAPQTAAKLEPPVVAPEAQWFNEDRAEQDKTLALTSEATQIYLKSILQKSIVAARQRENLDGIRLWHLQHGPSEPPMSLRLGCDVNRQIAQAQGNAAKTVQRMEEALSRQTRVPAKARQLDNDETLYNATSMSDLALRPELANAAEEADVSAKRSFQVYGGKEATETAPFGRLPKRAKITAKDFSLAREWSDYSHQRKGIATPQLM